MTKKMERRKNERDKSKKEASNRRTGQTNLRKMLARKQKEKCAVNTKQIAMTSSSTAGMGRALRFKKKKKEWQSERGLQSISIQPQRHVNKCLHVCLQARMHQLLSVLNGHLKLHKKPDCAVHREEAMSSVIAIDRKYF